MKIVVFKGGLGNQLFQYAFYKYLSRKDETFYFYNDAWYNVSHNGFELDKYFKTDDLKKCSRFWIILFKTILSKLYEGGNLAASKIRNLECPSYEICLIDYGCGKFNRKIHIMEQYP